MKISIPELYDLERFRAALWAAVEELERRGVTHVSRAGLFLDPFKGADGSNAMPAATEGFEIRANGAVLATPAPPSKPARPKSRPRR